MFNVACFFLIYCDHYSWNISFSDYISYLGMVKSNQDTLYGYTILLVAEVLAINIRIYDNRRGIQINDTELK